MTLLHATWVVLRFECRRALKPGRLAVVIALAVFPVALLSLIQYQGAQLETRGTWAVALFILIPEIVCLLGLLLWATPVIHTEIEQKTWAYLAVRPAGKIPILLGKYWAAVLWAVLTGLVSLSLAIGVVVPRDRLWEGWRVFAQLVLLSSVAYGSLYVLLGVLFPRRGMIAAVVYTFFFEFLIGWIPAMVNQFTVQFHLRTLLLKWLDLLPGGARFTAVAGDGPAWQHVTILLALVAAPLVIAALILRQRELVTSHEG